MSPVRTSGDDDSERRVLADIATYGWHCVGIHAEGDEAGFAFTIGLFQTIGHPELVVFGLPPQVAMGIFNIVVDAARSGKPLDLAKPTDQLVEGFECRFAKVPAARYRDFVGMCRWYYQGDDFPLYQVVWPARDGTFPWHPDASPDFRRAQPVIAAPPLDA